MSLLKEGNLDPWRLTWTQSQRLELLSYKPWNVKDYWQHQTLRERHATQFSPKACKRPWFYQHLDLRLAASKTVREKMYIILSLPIGGILLQQPKQTNIHTLLTFSHVLRVGENSPLIQGNQQSPSTWPKDCLRDKYVTQQKPRGLEEIFTSFWERKPPSSFS